MAGPYYQQPGQYPQGHQGQPPRGMPPRKKKGNDAMVWTIAIVVSLVCVVGAIILMVNRPGAGQQQQVRTTPPDQVLASLMAGMFESNVVKESPFYQHLDQSTREAIEGSRGLVVPKRNPRVTPATSLDGYIERLGRQRAIQAQHPTLMAMEAEFEALQKKLNAKDDPEVLRQAVLEFPEFASKLRLVHAKGRVDNEATRKRHRDKLEEWGGKLRNLASPRTNREYGAAKNKVLSDRESNDYKQLMRMEALNMYCNNIEDYPTIEALANDINTKNDYELLKDFFPRWSEEILTAYNRDTAAWVKALVDDATSRYEEAAGIYNQERDAVNNAVDAYVRGQTAALSALEGLVTRAGMADDEAVRKRLDGLRNSIEEARRMRYE